MANQKIMKKEVKKTWRFSQGNMNLDFTLNLDVKTDLCDFLQCLKDAAIEVEKEIKNFNGTN